jgi:hypothetical protein
LCIDVSGGVSNVAQSMDMFQPGGIVAFQAASQTYILSANEGEARDYGGFSEESRATLMTGAMTGARSQKASPQARSEGERSPSLV